MKWSDNTTYKFVQEYLKHECLYNSKCPKYRKKRAKNAAINKICEVMKISDFGPREAVSKIKSIRSTYSQEVKKINESTKKGAETDEVYVPILKWFKLYHKVMTDKNLTPKKIDCNSDSVETAAEEVTSDTDEEVEDTQYTNQQETETSNTSIYNQKRNTTDSENLVNKIKVVEEIVHKPPVNENEFSIFGRSVAAQLNALPLVLALQAQSNIQNYLSSIRIQELVNPVNHIYQPAEQPCHTNIPMQQTANVTVSGVPMDNNITPVAPTTYHIISPMVLNGLT